MFLPFWLGWTVLVRPLGLEILWLPWGLASAPRSLWSGGREPPWLGELLQKGFLSLPLSSRKRNEPCVLGARLPVCRLLPPLYQGPGGAGTGFRCPVFSEASSSLCGVGLYLIFLKDSFIVIWHQMTPGDVSDRTTANLRGEAGPGAEWDWLQGWPCFSVGTLSGCVVGLLAVFLMCHVCEVMMGRGRSWALKFSSTCCNERTALGLRNKACPVVGVISLVAIL